jgi:hypothetical protein
MARKKIWEREQAVADAAVSPPSRTNWSRRVPHPVLIGHAASLTPYRPRLRPSDSHGAAAQRPPLAQRAHARADARLLTRH